MKSRPVVLLVEDDPFDLVLMELAMKEAQFEFEFTVALDGQQALDWLLRRGSQAGRGAFVHPVLVLLDLKLPEMNGLEVLRSLRTVPEGRLIPVVVLSTSRMPSDIAAAYELGANAFVQKPMEFEKLVELVKALQHFWLAFNVTHPALERA